MTNRERIKKLWERTILNDEYDDAHQNERIYNNQMPGISQLNLLKKLHPPKAPVLDVGCGSTNLGVDYLLEPNRGRASKNEKTKFGWMEDLPFKDGELGGIILWGVFTFLRSGIEALMEANRTLTMGGSFLFDVILSSTMPLNQTVHYPSFKRHLVLHGFDVIGEAPFGTHPYNSRMGIHCIKVAEWDPRRFRMPQCTGKINNFLEERDWFMR